jgi:ABC-type taurine transport system ATPase subunit
VLTASELTRAAEMSAADSAAIAPWMRARHTERLAMALRLSGIADTDRAHRLSRLALIDVAMSGFDAVRGGNLEGAFHG